MELYHFLVLGQEPRQKYLAQFLREAGHEVREAGEYEPGYHDAVLLPVPQTALFLEKNLEKFQKGQTVYGCNFPLSLMQQGEKKGICFVDYLKRESVAGKNAVATAEGAIVEAVCASKINIQGSETLVVGYGRCGEVLVEKLTAWHAHVTVMERKEEKRNRAEVMGARAISFEQGKEEMGKFDFVFNTVPALVLTEEYLSKRKEEVTIIDIASKPGGVDFSYCQKKGIGAKLCLGLPGKYAPKSSARILMEVIEKTLWGEK